MIHGPRALGFLYDSFISIFAECIFLALGKFQLSNKCHLIMLLAFYFFLVSCYLISNFFYWFHFLVHIVWFLYIHFLWVHFSWTNKNTVKLIMLLAYDFFLVSCYPISKISAFFLLISFSGAHESLFPVRMYLHMWCIDMLFHAHATWGIHVFVYWKHYLSRLLEIHKRCLQE